MSARASGLVFARVEPPVEIRVGIIADAPGPRCPQAAHERALLRALFDELDRIDEVDRDLDRLRAWLLILDREVVSCRAMTGGSMGRVSQGAA